MTTTTTAHGVEIIFLSFFFIFLYVDLTIYGGRITRGPTTDRQWSPNPGPGQTTA